MSDLKKERYLKLYIAVLEEVPDFMTPTLVAHSMLSAHLEFESKLGMSFDGGKSMTDYDKWLYQSFRKCVVRVNHKEFEKIKKLNCYLGHENTTLNGEKSCAVIYPVWSDELPNVLKFAKLWEPKNNLNN